MVASIHLDADLSGLNTFGIHARAKAFTEVSSATEIMDLMTRYPEYPGTRWVILGGGSNVLFTRDVNGLVVLNRIMGKEILTQTSTDIVIRFGAGEIWHECVMWAVTQGWGGIENLALIPGTIGAAPMQNIGAYGVELKQVFVELEAVDLVSGETRIFNAGECRFGYRESYFKHEGRNRYFIVSVTLRLTPEARHTLSLEYGAIRDELAASGTGPYGIMDVARAVIRIRQSKLPDPQVTGNAGSFFKNPEIPRNQFEMIRERFPDIPSYPAGQGMVKIAAGWLIEKAGWKGQRRGNAGVHDRQALVLVNHGNATGQEILSLSEEIINSVQDLFGIKLHREVNIL